ncbi:MAG: hypothetical protein ACI39F_04735 [Acutalibacteraceae bacterium]
MTKNSFCVTMRIYKKYDDEDRRFSKSFQRVGDGERPIISLKQQITSE